ncbi:MAG TPA: crossover junction endodeoxyribonuclease RuvC [Phycisphaerales bacterium]|nr:crossover junction endodeoxyribonuclease RuvC [Phycisphaerales bacterium]
MEMRVLGVDPGLQVCGYACLDSDPLGESLVEAGVVRTTADLPLEGKLHQIAVDFRSLLDRLRPQVVAVEQLYAHYAHPRTAILMGHARGVILQCCAEAGVRLTSYSATRIKKSLTGSGRASKEQMQRTIRTILSLAEVPQPPDVADAIAAALCCANAIGRIVPT